MDDLGMWMIVEGIMLMVEIFVVLVLGGYYVNVYMLVNMSGELCG